MTQTVRSFALVIPTLNEAANIGAVLDRAAAALSASNIAWEILVVDDESVDRTARIAQDRAENDARIRVIVRHGQRGLAGAITDGWAQTDADLVGVMDADLQHAPEVLPRLIDAIRNGADIAIASRYLQSDSMDGWNPVRRFLSGVGVLAGRRVEASGLRVLDPLSGFFVLRRNCITGIEFQRAGFKLLLEILAKAQLHSVVEIPFKFGVRNAGTSKANAMTAVNYFVLLCKLSVNSIRRWRSG
jgi:dolichol-phosphate mannosyltransferase